MVVDALTAEATRKKILAAQQTADAKAAKQKARDVKADQNQRMLAGGLAALPRLAFVEDQDAEDKDGADLGSGTRCCLSLMSNFVLPFFGFASDGQRIDLVVLLSLSVLHACC